MATAKFLKRQAAKCGTLAKQTHDEESRQRCLWLEQTYLQLAEMEDQAAGQMSDLSSDDEGKLAT